MSHQLVWFRNDLRVSDNPALYHACEQGKAVSAIYIATPQQWREHDEADVKIDFWRRNLLCLQNALAELNIELHFFQVDSYQQIPLLIEKICQQWEIERLHFNHEYPINERLRDQNVIDSCRKITVEYQNYHDQLLLPPSTVRTKTGTPFKVFTPFAKEAKQQLEQSLYLYPTPPSQIAITLPELAEESGLKDIIWPNISQDIQHFWPAGEHHAFSRLVNFCQKTIGNYKQHRDIPSLGGTSRLSPYLASGIISVRQCWNASWQYCEPNDSVHVWQNELLWREFYKHVLIDYPYVSRHKPWKPLTEKIEWRQNEQELMAWQQGQTGFPLIDAAMRQLLARGWMHNRLRMVTAMFLSKHLLLDWRLGERWFMQHLIDGELAANNGGWQWSASTGTDSVPYFRIFNPVTQSKRFDPEGEFIRHYVPELAHLSDKEIHMPTKMNRPRGYPEPMVDLSVGRNRALATFKLLAEE
ncbi:MAG: deoxyribodipyrimidine photo-lyase [Pseudomonadota bacterium]|nr:deoxyribodipyrimidine photo-lyase [Pseudomonadota bacterium]MDO7667768.1 deoxyribodipyrimidine photo-lyase [Pseudomonadota bacterium]MDO7710124.1 deoxyribodipyrimidine photo-lyase [Pseudomonadota bacterium]